MKKTTIWALSLLTATSISSLAADSSVLEIEFTTGATMSGAITGGVKFVGTGNCLFTGSVSSNAELKQGNIKVYDMVPFGGDISMTGGTLELLVGGTSNHTVPTLHMTNPGTITAAVDMTLGSVDGSGLLTINGAGGVTFGGDMSSFTGGVSMGSSTSAHFIATTQLPNANNTFSTIYLDAARTSANSYDSANTILTANTINVSAGFAASEVTASLFKGTVKAAKISLGGKKWSVPVTAS